MDPETLCKYGNEHTCTLKVQKRVINSVMASKILQNMIKSENHGVSVMYQNSLFLPSNAACSCSWMAARCNLVMMSPTISRVTSYKTGVSETSLLPDAGQ